MNAASIRSCIELYASRLYTVTAPDGDIVSVIVNVDSVVNVLVMQQLRIIYCHYTCTKWFKEQLRQTWLSLTQEVTFQCFLM